MRHMIEEMHGALAHFPTGGMMALRVRRTGEELLAYAKADAQCARIEATVAPSLCVQPRVAGPRRRLRGAATGGAGRGLLR